MEVKESEKNLYFENILSNSLNMSKMITLLIRFLGYRIEKRLNYV
tara:strand:- start:743 stop:877 length:135 start_codon:yes stop_codon:yes gene_type:complete